MRPMIGSVVCLSMITICVGDCGTAGGHPPGSWEKWQLGKDVDRNWHEAGRLYPLIS